MIPAEEVDANSGLDRSSYATPGARMIFAITRLAEAGRLEVYQGTVPHATKLKRRAANKVAKASRKANR